MPEGKSIRELIKWGKEYLSSKRISSPQVVVELIAENITGKSRPYLYLGDDVYLDEKKKALFEKNIRRCARKVPLAYVICEQYFMGYRFFIRPGVFIPRPQTEILVEKSLQFLQKLNKTHPEKIIVVDIGTGCGNIAVTIAKEIKNAFIYAVDISSLALEVAKYNARYHRVSSQIKFLAGDLFSPLSNIPIQGKIDLIVSNPPYVEREKMRYLPEEVKKEPDFALDGGKEGLSFYQRIIPASTRWLRGKGVLMLEIGYNQAEKVLNMIRREKEFANSPCLFYDLEGNARVISVAKNN